MLVLLNDDDVRGGLSAADAVALMRSALLDHHRGGVHSPARLHAGLGPDGGLVFTTARTPGRTYGFRVYGTFPAATEQITAVYDEGTGRLAAIVTGAELGDRRTGALGGVAMDALARPDATVLGIVGTGRQAYTQAWAAAAVRPLSRIRVYGRDEGRRTAFADRCATELGVPTTPVAEPVAAVDGADIVVLGTTSRTPVVDAAWVPPGAHVTTVGPKTVDAHECPPELADRAAIVVTDSLAQLVAYGAPPLVPPERVVALGAIVAGAAGRTGADDVTLFVSCGLAGTELTYAAAILRARAARS